MPTSSVPKCSSPTSQTGKKWERGVYWEIDRMRAMIHEIKKKTGAEKRGDHREEVGWQTITPYLIGNAGVQIESSTLDRIQLLSEPTWCWSEFTLPPISDFLLPGTAKLVMARHKHRLQSVWLVFPVALSLCPRDAGYAGLKPRTTLTLDYMDTPRITHILSSMHTDTKHHCVHTDMHCLW